MPIYEYGCEACGHQLEVMQKMIEAPLKTCPSCGKDELHRLISATAFVLKGGGWYKDGYGSTGGGAKRTENQRGDRLEKAISDDKKKDSGSGSSGSSGSSDSGSSGSGSSSSGSSSGGSSGSSGSGAAAAS